MTLTQVLQGTGLFAAVAVILVGWFKYKTDSGQNANTSWSGIVAGYKEQVSFFASEVKGLRNELRMATERYEQVIAALEKERDHYRDLYLQSNRENVEWKEKYEALTLEIKELKKGGVKLENEPKSTL